MFDDRSSGSIFHIPFWVVVLGFYISPPLLLYLAGHRTSVARCASFPPLSILLQLSAYPLLDIAPLVN